MLAKWCKRIQSTPNQKFTFPVKSSLGVSKMSIKMSIVFYKYSVPLYKYFKENANTLLQLQALEALLLSHISSAVFSPAQLEFPGPLCSVRVQSSARPGTLELLSEAELAPSMLYLSIQARRTLLE